MNIVNFGERSRVKLRCGQTLSKHGEACAEMSLLPDNIPGAKWVYTTVEKHTVEQIKRWLKCRGLKTSGKKEELIKRSHDAENLHIPIDPSVDGGKWANIQTVRQTNSGIPVPPITGWKEFPQSGIPANFNTGHIYHHLIESIQSPESDLENQDQHKYLDCHTDKPLRRGKLYFKSGNVTDMKDHRINEFYFVKAKVLASMQKQKYSVMVTLSCLSGYIKDASCECKSSALGRCSHVAALLYAVNDCLEQSSRPTDIPCTSKPSTWNMGRKLGKRPKKLTETRYSSKQPRTEKVIQFDPRPPSERHEEIDREELNQFIISLQRCPSPNMWETIIPLYYEDFQLTAEDKFILTDQVNKLINNLTKKGPFEITAGQGDLTWLFERSLRVTASRARSVYKAKSTKVKEHLVKTMLWDVPVQTSGMQYGIDHEEIARNEFTKQHQNNLIVEKSGLWVNHKYPGIGASPDGIIHESNSGNIGVLEIKCPASIKNVRPLEYEKVLNKKQINAFCLCKSENRHSLKKTHTYYYQVQVQMGILEKEFCYFVLWTRKGTFEEKICFDDNLFKRMIPFLTKFHRNFLCPEYFLMRLPRRLPIYELSD